MALSEQMQQNILSKVLEDIAMINSSNKLKYERLTFDGWVDEFASLDSATIVDITPLSCDLTAHGFLGALKQWNLQK